MNPGSCVECRGRTGGGALGDFVHYRICPDGIGDATAHSLRFMEHYLTPDGPVCVERGWFYALPTPELRNRVRDMTVRAQMWAVLSRNRGIAVDEHA